MKKRIRIKISKKQVAFKPKNVNMPILKPVISKAELKRVPFSMGRKRWQINLNDVDPWPPNPHGDEIGGRHKLNLFNGKIYNRMNRKYVSIISKSDLNRLHKAEWFLELLRRKGISV